MSKVSFYYKTDIVLDQSENSRINKVFIYADPQYKYVIGHLVSNYHYYNHSDMNSQVICYPVSKIFIFYPYLGSTLPRMFKCQYLATESLTCEMSIIHKVNMPNLKSASRIIEKIEGNKCYSRIELVINQ